MRRVFGFILIGLGAFLLVLGPTIKWVVAPSLAVAPLGCDPGPLCDEGVSISPSTGIAATLFDPGTLTSLAATVARHLDASRVTPDVEPRATARTTRRSTTRSRT